MNELIGQRVRAVVCHGGGQYGGYTEFSGILFSFHDVLGRKFVKVGANYINVEYLMALGPA